MDRRDHGATTGRNAHGLALDQPQTPRIFAGDVERLPPSERRGQTAGLDARVVRVEPPPGGENEGELIIGPLDRRPVLDHREGRGGPEPRLVPQTAMQEQLPRMLLVVTRPLQPSMLFEPPVAHAGEDRRKRAHLVPDLLSTRIAPVVTETSRDPAQDPELVARVARGIERLAHALDAALAAGDGALAFAPSGGRGENHVSELRGRREEDLLHHEEVEPLEERLGAMLIGFRLAGILPDDEERL